MKAEEELDELWVANELVEREAPAPAWAVPLFWAVAPSTGVALTISVWNVDVSPALILAFEPIPLTVTSLCCVVLEPKPARALEAAFW